MPNAWNVKSEINYQSLDRLLLAMQDYIRMREIYVQIVKEIIIACKYIATEHDNL